MTKQTIANFLKQLRRTSGLSANEVTDKLQEYDIDISAKTLYGYESGLSMLNADAFVALCRIYKCDNPLEIFGSPTVKSTELEMINKYRNLDQHGREMVDFTLQKEWERSTTETSKADNVIPMAVKEDTPDYLTVRAAHNDAETTDEELEKMERDSALIVEMLKNKRK